MDQPNSPPSTSDLDTSQPTVSSTDLTLLSQSLESFQDITINGKKIIITVQDGFELTLDNVQPELAIFAEDLSLALTKSPKLTNLAVSCYSFAGSLDVAGSPGVEYPANTGTDSSQQGGNGTKAGNVSLYIESADPDSFIESVVAHGGKGGAGQSGVASSTGADGGNGGNGGDGGKVVIFAGSTPLQLLEKLRAINRLPSFEQVQTALLDFIDELGSSSVEGAGALSETLGDNLDFEEEDCRNAMQDVASRLQRMVTDYETDLKHSAVDVSGGAYGVYGIGKNNGQNGQPGKPGSLEVISFASPENLAAKVTQANQFFWVHPSQCARLLDKIKQIYWTLDPDEGHRFAPEDASQPNADVNSPASQRFHLQDLLLRLQARTKPFHDAEAGSPLVKFYSQVENEFGAIDAVGQLRSLYQQANNYLTQLQLHQDLFGRKINDVPLGSYSFYKDLLDPLIENFQKLEAAYSAFFNQLKQDKATREQIAAVRDAQLNVKRTAEAQIKQLIDKAALAATLIDSYQTILPPLCEDLNRKISQFRDKINQFSLDFDQLFSSLNSLAFERSPFMLAVQTAELTHDGLTNIVNDDGVKLNKNYLLRQVKTLTADFNVDELKQSYTTLNDGTIDISENGNHPTLAMLVAEENQINTILDGFYKQFDGLDDLKKALQTYIAQKQAQNRQILNYNATVLLIAQKRKIIEDADRQLRTLNDARLKQLSRFDLPDLVSFVSSRYYTARIQIMEIISLTERAYRFWALTESRPLFGGQLPSKIDSVALLAVKQQVLSDYQQAIEDLGTYPTPFPADPHSKGIVVDVPKERVDSLIKTGNIAITIPVARKLEASHRATRQPPATADRNSGNENKFLLMANVRVNLVRVWIEGAKITGQDQTIKIQVIHSGDEKIVSQQDHLFSFSHAPVSKVFMYNLTTREIVGEANFGLENAATLGATDQLYAALGPFTNWNIIVDPQANPHLDLTGVTGVQLEFHGTYFAFT